MLDAVALSPLFENKSGGDATGRGSVLCGSVFCALEMSQTPRIESGTTVTKCGLNYFVIEGSSQDIIYDAGLFWWLVLGA